MPLEKDRESKEYVYWPLVSAVSLAGMTAEVALTTVGVRPTEPDWVVATITDPSGPLKAVRLLVGPGGDINPPVGDRQVWIRLTLNPEVLVRKPSVLSTT